MELNPADHTIQVVAERISEGRSEIIRVRRRAIVETLPKLFALAISVSAYEKEDFRKDVFYAAADALKLADTIQRSSKPLYHEIQAVTLVDRDTTRRKILKALEVVSRQATPRDAVVIFFAGHDKRDNQNNFYVLPVETELDELAATAPSSRLPLCSNCCGRTDPWRLCGNDRVRRTTYGQKIV